MGTKLLMDQIIGHFPQRNLRFIFAYGSGVFQQYGHADASKNMLDFVFGVDDSVAWHEENFLHNRSHYSSLRHLGLKNIVHIQDHLGARVYYNTLVPCEGRLVKYGVISMQSLVNDLLDWETLYMSGRLHKPVTVLRLGTAAGGNTDLSQALVMNLQSAVRTSLLLLPEQFSEEELYTAIASLSYTGDFRMIFGEDRDKVQNIVRPNVELFRRLYEPVLNSGNHLHWNKTQSLIEQDLSTASRFHHLNLLPKTLMFSLVNRRNIDGRHRDTEEVLQSLADDSECPDVVRKCVAGIVLRSSITQTVKSVFTAGVIKTVRYAFSKLRKMWKIK